MKLYVFSDDDIPENELDDLARMLVIHSSKHKKKSKPKISDDDILKLAIALDLSVEQIDKIMGLD